MLYYQTGESTTTKLIQNTIFYNDETLHTTNTINVQ
jgi:hypothetical protein